ncbi:MAG: hypothetical protein UDB11_06325 [Peptococcaceae bacterium]|nr:hypothetical protein [Peptococcaceae bacterium]
MMRDILYASDFLDKDVLNLETGDLTGTISGILVEDAPLRAIAFAYRVDEGEEKRLIFSDFSQVTDIDQQVVVISSRQSYLPGDAKNVLGLSCLDANGKLIGKIRDLAWGQQDGMLKEWIVAGENEWFGVAVSDTQKVGNGAVILAVPETGIHKSIYQRTHAEQATSDGAEEMMRSLIRRVGATLSEAGQKVGERVKHIDTEELNRDINRFTEKVGKEIRNVIDNISEQTKAQKYANMESEIISVLRDLNGFTVSSAIYDKDGDVIIMPGYVIDENVVRRAIESEKIADLYRVAVSIKDTENGENHE